MGQEWVVGEMRNLEMGMEEKNARHLNQGSSGQIDLEGVIRFGNDDNQYENKDTPLCTVAIASEVGAVTAWFNGLVCGRDGSLGISSYEVVARIPDISTRRRRLSFVRIVPCCVQRKTESLCPLEIFCKNTKSKDFQRT